MSVFASLALVLGSIGLFGVLSSLVNQRTQEIGIRMALGAQTKDVLGMMLGEGFLPAWRAIRVNPMVALRYE